MTTGEIATTYRKAVDLKMTVKLIVIAGMGIGLGV